MHGRAFEDKHGIYELGTVCIGPIIFEHKGGFSLKYSRHETPIDTLN